MENSTLSTPKRNELLHVNENGFKFILFPKNKALYHGTISNTLNDLSNYNRLIKNLLKIDRQRSSGKQYKILKANEPLYLSNKESANLYGINKDTSFVVNVVHHSKNNNPSKKHVIPLYYVPGEHGITIEFSTKSSLRLFDLGNLENMKLLVDIIHKSSITEKKDFIETLVNTCIDVDFDDSYNVKTILRCTRKSYDWFDPSLVHLLCDIWQTKLNLPKIDGWIHFPDNNTNNKLHFEILLCNPFNLLNYEKMFTVPDTTYGNLPSWSELQRYNVKNGNPNNIFLVNSSHTVNIKSVSSLSTMYDANESL